MKKNILTSLLIISAIVASRLLPHPANFSPISALLLLTPLPFYVIPVKTRSSLVRNLSAVSAFFGLFLSDFFLGFHSTMPFVYGSYALIYLLGKSAKKDTLPFFTLPLFSALLFFVVTNFGVWATTSMYSRDFSGLMQSYWMGIPFLRMTLVGDTFYFFLLYGISIIREWRIEKLKNDVSTKYLPL